MITIASRIVEAKLNGVYLYVRLNGTYRVRVDLTIDGEKISRTTTYRPEKKFSEEENHRAAEITGKLFAEEIVKEYEDRKKGKRIAFEEFFEKVYKEKGNAYITEGTFNLNINTVENDFLKPLTGVEVRKIDKDMLQELARGLRKRVNKNAGEDPEDPVYIKPQTAKRYMSTLRAVLRLAHEMGIMEEDPSTWALKYAKIFYAPVRCLDDKDYNEIVKELRRKAEHHTLERNDIIVAICLLAGLRRGEMVALRWDCVPYLDKRANDEIVISISKSAYKPKGKKQVLKDLKTTHSVREFTISETLGLILSAWKKQLKAQGIPTGDNNHIVCDEYGDMVSVYAPTNLFKDYLKAHNLRDVKLHSLRHTFASMMVATEPNLEIVKYVMGHKDITTTQIYVHMFKMKDKAVMSGLNNYDRKLFEEKEEI